MFRYLLVRRDGEPNDPAVFVTAIPNWGVGETITLGGGDQFRVVAIDDEISVELVKHEFNGIFVVEPVGKSLTA